MPKELDPIALCEDLPEWGLRCGDIGTIVLLHGKAGYEVEFVSLRGETMAVVSLRTDQVRPLEEREIAHARLMESTAR